MNVGIAYPAFIESFRDHYPNILDLTNCNYEREIRNMDLVIFSGGEDINPDLYGKNITYSSGINNHRDAFEQTIFNYCIDFNIKMLGVCRGHQLINALCGGDLVQDLFFEQKSSHPFNHALDFIGESVTKTFYAPGVNSMHHQGVIEPGYSLKITSMHKGIIESTEGTNIITVQFHPEFMPEEKSSSFFKYLLNDWAAKKEKYPTDFRKTLNDIRFRKKLDNNPDFPRRPRIAGALTYDDIMRRNDRSNNRPRDENNFYSTLSIDDLTFTGSTTNNSFSNSEISYVTQQINPDVNEEDEGGFVESFDDEEEYN